MLQRLKSSTLSEFVDTKTSVATFRVLIAFFMLYGHGWGKLMSVFGGNFQFLDPLGIGPTASLILAAFAEGICSLLIMFGFWTRLASVILTINMAVAVFFVHLPAGDWFGDMELPVIYLVAFFVIFLLGPGNFSVDE
ncbi:MAG: DoxX family protein [Fodinibius sp.]|nr:DoxX family protein [Fodinibius sp.]